MVLSYFTLTVVGCYMYSCVYYFFFPLVMLSSNSQNPHHYDEVSIMLRISMTKSVGECFTVSFELSLVCFSSLSSMSMVTWLPCFPGKCSPIYFSIWKHSSHSMYATKYPLLLIMLCTFMNGLVPEIMRPHGHTLATCSPVLWF